MQLLVDHNHQFSAIPDYTLQQVNMIKGAIVRSEAARREETIIDLGFTIGSVFGGSETLEEHLGLLRATAEGATENGTPEQ